MSQPKVMDSIDYLLIGHLTLDLTAGGPRIGGSVAYSALTAEAMGIRVGIVTSWGEDLNLGRLRAIPIVNVLSEKSTTFSNVETDHGRKQIIHSVAHRLVYDQIPSEWRNSKIIHVAPVANEIDPNIINKFRSGLICVTPQGWIRRWDEEGQVYHVAWSDADIDLAGAGAAVVSMEDLNGNEVWIEDLVTNCRVLAVTEGQLGVRVYWNGDVRRFRPHHYDVVDTTGAGDIFATAFFCRLYTTRDPWEAARYATALAALSVTRTGLDATPTKKEIQDTLVEII